MIKNFIKSSFYLIVFLITLYYLFNFTHENDEFFINDQCEIIGNPKYLSHCVKNSSKSKSCNTGCQTNYKVGDKNVTSCCSPACCKSSNSTSTTKSTDITTTAKPIPKNNCYFCNENDDNNSIDTNSQIPTPYSTNKKNKQQSPFSLKFTGQSTKITTPPASKTKPVPNVKVHNNYYDVDLEIEASKNEINTNDLNIKNLIKDVQSKIKKQIEETTKTMTTKPYQSKSFKDTCTDVVFSGNVVEGVSYPKMYFRKENLKKLKNNRLKYYYIN